MSESGQYEKVTVSSDGVTVDKRFEEDEFPVPAIAFEVRSSRSETVTVVIVDEVPEDVAVEDLGFHPEYGSEYWTIDENRITFEREIEADSEYTTVYGIRATGTDDVEKFLTEPTLESVDPPLQESDDTVVDEGSSDVVRDVIAGDSDAVPGLEDDEGEETDEDVETLDLKDPNAPDEETASASGGSGGSDDSGGSGGGGSLEGADVDSLIGALAAELRNGNVEEDDVKLLRKAFDLVADGERGSVDARIQRLQTEVSDLLAYTDALEEFLDENGTGEELVEGFRDDLESLQSDLQSVGELARSHEESMSEIRSTVDSVESSMQSVESELDEVTSELDEVQSNVDQVENSVDGVEGTVAEVENTVDDVEASVEDVEGSVGDVETTVEEMESTVQDVEGSVEDVEGSVEDVESDLEDLESQVGDIDVEGVRSDIDEIEEEIEELNEWREQLSSVIGGGN